MVHAADLGVVVIGRNEGERLRACLQSLRDAPARVYVDSGSTDGSQELARELGFRVVDLPTPPNFTAARARNAGLKALLDETPRLPFVQMVDGDCEVAGGWLDAAVAALRAQPETAAIFGRRRERHPEASIYNRLCDIEWDVPLGEASSCGGDAIFRVSALMQAGGYTSSLIAGEEPDLCLRMRQRGWRILRIDAEMTVHDADIRHFSQWWRRSQRSGHAYAELCHRHGREADPRWLRQQASIFSWGSGMVAAAFVGLAGLVAEAAWALFISGAALMLVAAQVIRLTLGRARSGHPLREAFSWAFFLMLGKIPQLHGMLQFHARRGRPERLKLIEYKS